MEWTVEDFHRALRGELRDANGHRYEPAELMRLYLQANSATARLTRWATGEERRPDGHRYELADIVSELLGATGNAELDDVSEGLRRIQRAAETTLLALSGTIPGGVRALLERLDLEGGTHRPGAAGAGLFHCSALYGVSELDPALVTCRECAASYGLLLPSPVVLEALEGDHVCFWVDRLRELARSVSLVQISEVQEVIDDSAAARMKNPETIRPCATLEALEALIKDRTAGEGKIVKLTDILNQHAAQMAAGASAEATDHLSGLGKHGPIPRAALDAAYRLALVGGDTRGGAVFDEPDHAAGLERDTEPTEIERFRDDLNGRPVLSVVKS